MRVAEFGGVLLRAAVDLGAHRVESAEDRGDGVTGELRDGVLVGRGGEQPGRGVVGEPAGAGGRAFEAEDAGVLGDQRRVSVPSGQGELVAVADEQQRGPGGDSGGADDAAAAGRPEASRRVPVEGVRQDVAGDRADDRIGAGERCLAARHGGGGREGDAAPLADQRADRVPQPRREGAGGDGEPVAVWRGGEVGVQGLQRALREGADLVVGAEGGADRGGLGRDLVGVDGPLGEPGPGPVLKVRHRAPLDV